MSLTMKAILFLSFALLNLCLIPRTRGEQYDDFPGDIIHEESFEDQATHDDLQVQQHIDSTEPQPSDGELDESPDNHYDFIRIFAGLYYQNTYKQINEYLVDHLEATDPQANLQLALDWLNDEKKRPNFFNKHFIDGLTQFTNLLQTKQRCDRVGYAILLKNDRATKHVTHKTEQPINLRRIDYVVYQTALKHAVDCLPVYPNRYRQIVSTMDATTVAQVEDFLGDILSNILLSKKKFFSKVDLPTTIEATGNIKTIRDNKNEKVLYNLIQRLAINDSDRKYLRKVVNEKSAKLEVNKAKVELLYERYLAQPCRYYIGQLGPDVFIPASYDILMFRLEDRYHPDDGAISDFLLGWSRYKLCRLIAVKEREGLIRDLIKLVNKQ